MVFTNHHVGADCIQKLSTKERDYMQQGFTAQSRAVERECPDLELNVLLKIENESEKVKGATPEGATPAEAATKRCGAMSEIEKSCATATGHRCDVVTLFSGGQYHLYEYQKYTDIRLVFAPEKDIAFFGGDADNFTYPRWDLDVRFFRVYENGKPLRPIPYFPFSKTGVRKGELTFVSGNPGSTGRLMTYAEMEFQRDVQMKFNLERTGTLIAALKEFSKRGPEQTRVAVEEIFGNENSFKAYTGFVSGLNDPKFMASKKAQEVALRAAIAGDPSKEKLYGSAWTEMEKIIADYGTFYQNFQLFEGTLTRSGEPLAIGKLGANNAVLKEILAGRTPEATAREAIATSKLIDIDIRKRIANSIDAARNEPDGIMLIVRVLKPGARKYRKMWEDRVQARQAIETARIAQAQYSLGGNVYPDATFTLRLSFGPAVGYKNAMGEIVSWATDFAGMYKHATGVDPYKLPERWLGVKKTLNPSVPFNVVTRADTHEIVEALRKVYRADALLKELGF